MHGLTSLFVYVFETNNLKEFQIMFTKLLTRNQ